MSTATVSMFLHKKRSHPLSLISRNPKIGQLYITQYLFSLLWSVFITMPEKYCHFLPNKIVCALTFTSEKICIKSQCVLMWIILFCKLHTKTVAVFDLSYLLLNSSTYIPFNEIVSHWVQLWSGKLHVNNLFFYVV